MLSSNSWPFLLSIGEGIMLWEYWTILENHHQVGGQGWAQMPTTVVAIRGCIACRKFISNNRNNQICLVFIIIMCWQFYKNVSEKIFLPSRANRYYYSVFAMSHHPKREKMRYFETCSLIDSSVLKCHPMLASNRTFYLN